MSAAQRRERRTVLQVVRKTLLTLAALAAALALPPASAPAAYNVLLAGGAEANRIQISLTPDGRQYAIESVVPLEVGGEVCVHREGRENELICDAPEIVSFEVNAGAGDDFVSVASTVPVPVTIRAGSGNDTLAGGGGADKLIGGAGDDDLSGGAEGDALIGGPGADVLRGGGGVDLLIGGPGKDLLRGGPGRDAEIQETRKQR
jgi:Ca2+-binding RTX toxin-like protein